MKTEKLQLSQGFQWKMQLFFLLRVHQCQPAPDVYIQRNEIWHRHLFRQITYQCWFMNSFCVMVNVHSLLFNDSSSWNTIAHHWPFIPKSFLYFVKNFYPSSFYSPSGPWLDFNNYFFRHHVNTGIHNRENFPHTTFSFIYLFIYFIDVLGSTVYVSLIQGFPASYWQNTGSCQGGTPLSMGS